MKSWKELTLHDKLHHTFDCLTYWIAIYQPMCLYVCVCVCVSVCVCVEALKVLINEAWGEKALDILDQTK